MSNALYNFKQVIKRSVRDTRWQKWSQGLAAEEDAFTRNHNTPELSRGEIAEIRKIWKGVCQDLRVGFGGFRDFKKHFGFNAQYVPFSYFFPWIVRSLNPVDVARTLGHKGLAYTYFKGLAMPHLIANRICGSYFNAEGASVTEAEVFRNFVGGLIKPSRGSCCGKGVSLIPPGTSVAEKEKILSQYAGDFVIQAILDQCEDTKRFNASSLNTFRVSTLYLNGRFSVCTSMLRFGTPGNIVDNVGAGGGCVGIRDNGSLMPFGFNKAGYKIKEWNGILFDGCKIKEFKKVLQAAKDAHGRIPLCAFVGWDLAIDQKGEVNIIEANLDWPGLFFEQLANGRPAFGDRFDEVLEYVHAHPVPLSPIYYSVT